MKFAVSLPAQCVSREVINWLAPVVAIRRKLAGNFVKKILRNVVCTTRELPYQVVRVTHTGTVMFAGRPQWKANGQAIRKNIVKQIQAVLGQVLHASVRKPLILPPCAGNIPTALGQVLHASVRKCQCSPLPTMRRAADKLLVVPGPEPPAVVQALVQVQHPVAMADTGMVLVVFVRREKSGLETIAPHRQRLPPHQVRGHAPNHPVDAAQTDGGIRACAPVKQRVSVHQWDVPGQGLPAIAQHQVPVAAGQGLHHVLNLPEDAVLITIGTAQAVRAGQWNNSVIKRPVALGREQPAIAARSEKAPLVYHIQL